ncbi:MAG: hypothetical protein FWD90_02190 [Defluviitaleaceae bacterium]|nr:hypothetical protein [Defluviitaleaceae bacterium]
MSNEEKILSMLTYLTTKVEGMEIGLTEVKTDLTEVKTDLTGVKTDLTEFKTDVNTRFDKMETEFTTLRHIVAKIEIEHGQKLSALFDGYAMQREITVEMRDNIKLLLATQDEHDTRIKIINARTEKSA